MAEVRINRDPQGQLSRNLATIQHYATALPLVSQATWITLYMYHKVKNCNELLKIPLDKMENFMMGMISENGTLTNSAPSSDAEESNLVIGEDESAFEIFYLKPRQKATLEIIYRSRKECCCTKKALTPQTFPTDPNCVNTAVKDTGNYTNDKQSENRLDFRWELLAIKIIQKLTIGIYVLLTGFWTVFREVIGEQGLIPNRKPFLFLQRLLTVSFRCFYDWLADEESTLMASKTNVKVPTSIYTNHQ